MRACVRVYRARAIAGIPRGACISAVTTSFYYEFRKTEHEEFCGFDTKAYSATNAYTDSSPDANTQPCADVHADAYDGHRCPPYLKRHKARGAEEEPPESTSLRRRDVSHCIAHSLISLSPL